MIAQVSLYMLSSAVLYGVLEAQLCSTHVNTYWNTYVAAT